MSNDPTIFDLIAADQVVGGKIVVGGKTVAGGKTNALNTPSVAEPELLSGCLSRSALDTQLTAALAAQAIPSLELPPGPRGTRLWVYDTEVFPNLVLHVFTDGREIRVFHQHQWPELVAFISNPQIALVGFNNIAYDDVLLRGILRRSAEPYASPVRLDPLVRDPLVRDPQDDLAEVVRLSAQAIAGEVPKEIQRLRMPWGLSIDLHQLLNAGASLKEWECRLGFAVVAESPYDFTQPVPVSGLAEVLRYCCNDVHATMALLLHNRDLITMRQRVQELYHLASDRIFSSSEAKIAESTMLELLRRDSQATMWSLREGAKRNPDNAPQSWAFTALISPRIGFTSAPFTKVFSALRQGVLTIGEDYAIRLALPALPDLIARVAGTRFQLGVGGLHSLDGPGTFHASDDSALIDVDVTSYYPSLIINEGWYPRHLGPRFIDHLRSMRDQRVAAKKAGDKRTANALKIVINSVYGKLNDQFSGIRSIPDAFRVTINGQLMLLMLIEHLHALGATILGANTDGVTVSLPRAALTEHLPQTIAEWERDTGLSLEQVRYRSFFRRDVNNYLAVSEDGQIKTKGVFGDGAKGDGTIVRRAAIEYLTQGRDPADTVSSAERVEDFLYYQRCRRDAVLVQGSHLLGRTVRWYCTYADPPIVRRAITATSGGTTVNHGHRCRLALDIRGKTVADLVGLDRSYYSAQARELISSVGVDLPL